MSKSTVACRRGAPAAALFAAVLTLLALAAPAGAAPGAAGADDEGASASLHEQLDAAAKGYLDAEAALEHSRQRQQQLTGELAHLEAELGQRTGTVEEIASVAYRTGRLGALSALLGAQSPDGLLDRAAALNVVAANENQAVHQLAEARDRVSAAKAAIDNEVRQQQRQLAVMGQRKKQAEQALADAAAREARPRQERQPAVEPAPAAAGTPARAAPAPRNSDGSWPPESCSVDDPTTDGCLTPRTLHAYNEARAAGFTRYVSCFRPGSWGEHPKGRACDWAAQRDGFGGAATGDDRTYGNNLAAYFIANASRLGVLYVIWYRQIWLPGSGWRSYSGSGSPSAEHTNHVHLSVY
jgi:hypothetical protein